jgi:hypothetical protein
MGRGQGFPRGGFEVEDVERVPGVCEFAGDNLLRAGEQRAAGEEPHELAA